MNRGTPPPVVKTFVTYFLACSIVAGELVLLARLSELPASPVLLYGIYSFCFGTLGACTNATLAVAKHCAAQDFQERWNWWYWTKPPMGAAMGVIVYVLSQGFTDFLSGSPARNGFGIAAVAFIAGFAVERVVRKIEETSKTLFQVDTPPLEAYILEPAEGQHVGTQVRVVVHVPESTTFLQVSCLDEPAPPVALQPRADKIELWEAVLPLSGSAPTAANRKLHVAGLCDDQRLEAGRTVSYQHP
jgi:hypothetical protein